MGPLAQPEHGEFARDYASATEIPPAPPPIADRTFLGYRRARRQGGHAELHRRHLDRQLLGLGLQVRRRAVRSPIL